MARLYFLVEGSSEERLVRELLIRHLASFKVYAYVRMTSPKGRSSRRSKGGVSTYKKIRADLSEWMKEHNNPDSYFTTMFDLYALPRDFPGWAHPVPGQSPRLRVENLEKAFGSHIGNRRFVPYIQLHEFEALYWSDLSQLEVLFPGSSREIDSIRKESGRDTSPEEIDEGLDTAPSKRIIKHLPEFRFQKTVGAVTVLSSIGLDKIRSCCPHFDQWITRLEELGSTRNP